MLAPLYRIPNLHCHFFALNLNYLGVELYSQSYGVIFAERVLDVLDDERSLSHSAVANHDQFETDLGVEAENH